MEGGKGNRPKYIQPNHPLLGKIRLSSAGGNENNPVEAPVAKAPESKISNQPFSHTMSAKPVQKVSPESSYVRGGDPMKREKRAESGIRPVDATCLAKAEWLRQVLADTFEKEAENDPDLHRLDKGRVELIRDQIVGICVMTYPETEFDSEKIKAKFPDLCRLSGLYKSGTLADHQRIETLLGHTGLLAQQQWNDVHIKGDLNLSQIDLNDLEGTDTPNHFIRALSDPSQEPGSLLKNQLRRGRLFFELGPGRGSDARFIAQSTGVRVIGVDISEEAVRRANAISRMNHLYQRVTVMRGDFLNVLQRIRGQLVHVIFSNSTFHYKPHEIVKEQTMPTIAEVLKVTDGRFCMAMKLVSSASANSPYQMRLDPGNPYNPSVNLQQNIHRYYPTSEQDVHALVEPSFDIEYSQVVSEEGYEKDDEVEHFCLIVGRPR